MCFSFERRRGNSDKAEANLPKQSAMQNYHIHLPAFSAKNH